VFLGILTGGFVFEIRLGVLDEKICCIGSGDMRYEPMRGEYTFFV
jgi:hypothetical protein